MTAVLLTGATSFTGVHIAEQLAQTHSLRQPMEVYACVRLRPRAGVEESRYAYLKKLPGVKVVPYDGFEASSFLTIIENLKPHVLINHGTHMDRYREKDYDVLQAMRVSAVPLPQVLKTFGGNGGKLFVHSGSIFEPGEGQGDRVDQALSVYGATKAAVYGLTRFHCREAGIPLLKVVIPNPVGPFENSDRLIPIFMRKWLNRETPVLSQAQLVRDQLPAPWLGEVYAHHILRLLAQRASPAENRVSPSGFVGTQRAFVDRLALEMGARLRLPTPVEYNESPSSQPLRRIGTDSVVSLLGKDGDQAWRLFWDQLAIYFQNDVANTVSPRQPETRG
jgi:nucleoside-diphosphate-sugar epimerase